MKPGRAGSIFQVMDTARASNPAPSVVVACTRCGQKNRVLASRLGQATCGSCKAALAPAHPLAVTDGSWQREVLESPWPVLVDFWAPWCGPCRAVAPTLERIAAERAGRLKVVKVNVDENPAVSARFGIQSIPTLMVFRGGRVVDQIRGALPKPALDAQLDRLGL